MWQFKYFIFAAVIVFLSTCQKRMGNTGILSSSPVIPIATTDTSKVYEASNYIKRWQNAVLYKADGFTIEVPLDVQYDGMHLGRNFHLYNFVGSDFLMQIVYRTDGSQTWKRYAIPIHSVEHCDSIEVMNFTINYCSSTTRISKMQSAVASFLPKS